MDTVTGSSKPTSCAACSAAVCRPCLERYLLSESSKDPCCPACDKPWTHTFLATHMTATFRKGAYKHHRETVLHDREKARLPETQADAVRYRNAKAACAAVAQRVKELQAQMAALPEVIEYRRVKWDSMDISELITAEINKRDASRPIRVELGKIYERNRPSLELTESYGALRAVGGAATANVAEPERRAFMMRCVQTGCEGFVNTAYKCGLCDAKVCSHCHAVKTDDAHTCAPDAVASVAALRKEARPCPKCAAPISKIDGCDQIWCTLCKTAFSWRTGKIETGIIHNPHYYQWMRETGQTIPRRDELGGGPCGGLDTVAYALNNLRVNIRANTALDSKQKLELSEKSAILFTSIHYYHHTRAVALRPRIDDGDEKLRQLRVMRLVGELDDAAWKKRLQMLEKADEKERTWRQLYEMYCNCYTDIVTPVGISTGSYEALNTMYDALVALQKYVTREAYKIMKLFDCVLDHNMNRIINSDLWIELTAPKRKARRPAAGGAGLEI